MTKSARPRKQTAPAAPRVAEAPANVTAPAARMTLRRMVLPGIGIGFACGMAATAIVLGSGVAPVGHAEAQASAPAAVPEALVARIGQLESALGRLEAAAAERTDTLARRIERTEAIRSAQGERFIAAALVLQASVATARPWLREYQAMARLAPPGMLPAPLNEVLLSHAARGLPTEAELRERYIALVPQLVARSPRQGDMMQQAVSTMRGAVATIGLVSAPAPSDHEQAIEGVVQHLRRGNLAAAVGDAAALDASLQPLLSGWLAQAGARLAVEQAVQETLLRMLAAPARS
jgi:hypothetical protein